MQKPKKSAKKCSEVDLTLVLTAHSEGLLIHKTLLSVFRALEPLVKAGRTYEAIIHVDNGNDETLEYLRRYRDRKKSYLLSETEKEFKKHLRIFENSFGDLGLSRNFAIGQAHGKYVATLDLDDLISQNYLVRAVEILDKRTNEDLILHAECRLSFWERNAHTEIQKLTNSQNKSADARMLAVVNLWGSFAVAKREIFIKHPYRQAKNGIGFEDWGFNVDTINAGCRHETVPDTIYFYRRKDDSLLGKTAAESATIDYSPLFDFKTIAGGDLKPVAEPPTRGQKSKSRTKKRLIYSVKKSLVGTYVALRNTKIGNALLEPVATVAKRVYGGKLVKTPEDLRMKDLYGRFPTSFFNEWKEMATIDSLVYPSKERLGWLDFHQPEQNQELASTYVELARKARDHADYVFVLPWLKRGGADKLVLNYVRAFLEINPKIKIVLITTLNVESTWLDRVPPEVSVVEFGKMTAELTEAQRDGLFTRLILQLQPKVIHNINSAYCYDWLRRHRALLSGRFKINVSLFGCGIHSNDPRDISDYANPRLRDIYDVVDKIISDNSQTGPQRASQYGFDIHKFVVQHQPYDARSQVLASPDRGAKLSIQDHRLHILWASRVCYGKNPEILVKIADELNKRDEGFVIDVYGEMDGEMDEGLFKDVPNLMYHGAYDSMREIYPEQYDCFLYTSLSDGMPNVLLEVASRHVPIISTGVGGITDFIKDGVTGLIVQDPCSESEYIAALELIKNEVLANKLADNALRVLETEFSWKTYLETIRSDFGWLLDPSSRSADQTTIDKK